MLGQCHISIHGGWWWSPDGSENAAARLDRVLTSDPGKGVVRHADTGCDEALAVAAERGVRLSGPARCGSHSRWLIGSVMDRGGP